MLKLTKEIWKGTIIMEELNREALEKDLLDSINEYAKALASFRIAEDRLKEAKAELNKINDQKVTEESVR